MPYADPEKQREAQAKWYAEKYRSNKKFRKAELKRKVDYQQTPEGRAVNAASTRRYEEKLRLGRKKKR